MEGSVYKRITTRQALAVDRGRPGAAPGPAAAVSGWVLNTRITSRAPSPRSVRMCESGSHVIVLRHRETGSVSFEPFRCNSWRCERCRGFKGAQDFVRVRDAMLACGDEWVYLVLTLSHSNYANEWAAYNAGYFHWQKLSKRLIRLFGPLAYIQTWEKHQSGFPHVNLVIHNSKIWDLCRGDGWKRFRQMLKPMLVSVGFGYVVHVAPLRSGGALTMTGYLTKLSRELTGAEVKNQVPVNAPLHFRRLRASRGLLPPIYRPGKHEGALIPVKALGSVDLSPEGWLKRKTSIVGHSRQKKGGCGDGSV